MCLNDFFVKREPCDNSKVLTCVKRLFNWSNVLILASLEEKAEHTSFFAAWWPYILSSWLGCKEMR